MIVADRLGVAPDDVEVLHSDTAISPLGLDTYGSRSLAVGGVAIYQAVDKVIDKARLIAAHLMEAAPEDLEFEAGTFSVRGSPDHALPLAAVAFEAFTAHNLPDGVEPNLEAHVTYDPPNFSWPFGTHICVVEVDEETGAGRRAGLRGRRRLRQPDQPAHRRGPGARRGDPGPGPGPVRGGRLRRRRQPAPPPPWPTTWCRRPATCPRITTGSTITPSPTNPLGVKGIGEAGTIGVGPGRHQRRGRRPRPARRHRRGHAGVAPERLDRHPGGPPEPTRLRRLRLLEEPDDPRRLRLRPGRLRPTRPSPCSPSTATRPSSSPAATRCCR